MARAYSRIDALDVRYHRVMQNEGGPKQPGPEGSEFLQLELSRWLESSGRSQANEVIRDLLREAIRARLDARLGERIRAAGAAIADEIADDFEANLAIEERIDARRDARTAAVDAARKLLRGSAAKPGKKR